jgi:hypothetical protein
LVIPHNYHTGFTAKVLDENVNPNDRATRNLNRRRASYFKPEIICGFTPNIGECLDGADSDDAGMSFRDHAAGHSGMIPPPSGGAFRQFDLDGFSGPGQE